MTFDDHLIALGKLLGNIHALETSLRSFLSNRPGARPVHEVFGTDILDLPVGTELPESDLTSHAYLSELVERFNAIASSDGHRVIDSRVVEIRNMLMHGNVLAREAKLPVHILKFSKPVAGKVRITTNEKMTTEWFSEQHRAVAAAVQAVVEHPNFYK